jgi:hypothetical protein
MRREGVNMPHTGLRPDCLCECCAGCFKINDVNFSGKYNCRMFKPVDKKVWCADEIIERFLKTGKIE